MTQSRALVSTIVYGLGRQSMRTKLLMRSVACSCLPMHNASSPSLKILGKESKLRPTQANPTRCDVMQPSPIQSNPNPIPAMECNLETKTHLKMGKEKSMIKKKNCEARAFHAPIISSNAIANNLPSTTTTTRTKSSSQNPNPNNLPPPPRLVLSALV